MKLRSFVRSKWVDQAADWIAARSAVTGETVALVPSGGIDMRDPIEYGRSVGGPNLRALSFHQRADLLKKIGQFLTEQKDELYRLSLSTGATKSDGMIDIDGGIGTLFVYASKGKRELPNAKFLIDGAFEGLGKGGTFGGQHILVPRWGVAIHINAFNFPCWGLLEKFASAFLAGVPVITKPATVTAYLAHKVVELMTASGALPDGALQLILGATGELFDHLTGQDLVAFTGSAETSQKLQSHPVIVRETVRFIAERDSLNAAILAPDAAPGTPEFDLFIKEVAKEMTVKAGQKCTAIRRAFVPNAHIEAATAALRDRLSKIVVGDPALDNVRMGPVVGLEQRADILQQLRRLQREAKLVIGDPEDVQVEGADKKTGAFLPPMVLLCEDPASASEVHAIEAFGPVSTLMGYGDVGEAITLAHRGGGSLVASVYTYDLPTASDIAFGIAPQHGRIAFIDRDCAKEQTGHGSPMPHLVHGGPGRAGGGEELGGVRSLSHYMQRTALQGSPGRITSLVGRWVRGAPQIVKDKHPFRYHYEELDLGQTFVTGERTITLDDIEKFAHLTGDTFYAHMDEEAVKGHPFFKGRVAHGYLVLSYAAGLFVDPPRGPVLANYGLDSLRFVKPVEPGDTIKVRLTVKEKFPRSDKLGEVTWDVEVTTATGETAASYQLLTVTARLPQS
jgi:oxepin-CoA hydrolase/3-oxo-5,6-dehydrosuberyl-CoA semialdehyde dehydrogenase